MMFDTGFVKARRRRQMARRVSPKTSAALRAATAFPGAHLELVGLARFA